MAMRNPARVRVEIERVIAPKSERQISRGHCVPGADLPQVQVVDEETAQAQEDWCFQRSPVKADRFSG